MSHAALSAEQLSVVLPFLDLPDRSLLAPYLTELRLDPGAALFGVEDPVDGLWFLLEGRLAVRKINPLYGRAQVIALLDPGAMVGERALLGGGRHRAEVRAVASAHLVLLDRTALDRLALEQPEIYLSLLRRALVISGLRLDRVSERLAAVL